MKNQIFRILVLSCVLVAENVRASQFFVETRDPLTPAEVNELRNVEGLLAAEVSDVIVIDDMMFRVSTLLESGFSGVRWTNAKFVYTFDAGVTDDQRAKFKAACAVWEAVSAVTCIRRTTEANYVYVQNSRYNRSYVGMIGGRQELDIYNWNWKFIVAHEIGHALGLSHEQSRSDRDTYVKILLDNVRDGAEHNFRKSATTNYSTYDFRSIMHYGPSAFSKNGGPTIEPQPGHEAEGAHMGNRNYLSAADAAGMASRYGARRVTSGN